MFGSAATQSADNSGEILTCCVVLLTSGGTFVTPEHIQCGKPVTHSLTLKHTWELVFSCPVSIMILFDPQNFISLLTQPDWKYYTSSKTELRQIL